MHPRTSKSDTFGIISRCMGFQGPFKAQPLTTTLGDFRRLKATLGDFGRLKAT